jgi:hypothetical protein
MGSPAAPALAKWRLSLDNGQAGVCTWVTFSGGDRSGAEAGMGAVGDQAGAAVTPEQRAQAGPGGDLVLAGGGVKGAGLVEAVLTLHDAGYAFPRAGGTRAGAIAAAPFVIVAPEAVVATEAGP